MLHYVCPSLTPGAIDDSSNSSQVLQVMLEMTRHVLGGTEAWLLESGEDCCEVVMQNPAGCDPVPPSGKMMTGQFHQDPYPHCILKDGSHGVCLEVLRASDKQDPFYLVVVKLPSRMDLGEREKGLLGGLCCAFAAACINLQVKHEWRMPSDTVSHLVCCAACRRLQTGHQAWTHWDHLSDRQAFLKPVSHTVCEACAIKLYGLALGKYDQQPEVGWRMH